MQTRKQEHLEQLLTEIEQYASHSHGLTQNRKMFQGLRTAIDEVKEENYRKGQEDLAEKLGSECRQIEGELDETYREYDIPGDGYFIHLLNQPLIDYNIIDLVAIGITLGAVGFLIFALTQL